jgi:hypothetical protein
VARLPNIVLSLVAFEGAGKTNFWLSAPKPIAVISTDTNTEATARKVLDMDDDADFDDDVVKFEQVSMPALAFDDRDDVQDEAKDKWEAVRDFLRPLLKADEDERPKTVVFDTAVDIFDLRVLAEFGKLDQIPPEVRRNMMGRCNTSYKGIVQAFKDRGVNVILVHRAKEKWTDKITRTNSGIKEERVRMLGAFDMERAGFKDTGFITTVEAQLAFDPEREGKLTAKYGMRVSRCNPRPGLIGKEYWGSEKQEDGSRIHR